MSETDPFATGRTGGSPRTATALAATSSDATILRRKAPRTPNSLWDQGRRSFCAPQTAMLFSDGDAQFIGATHKRASSVPSSATRVRYSQASLSDRLTRSLIESGLVCGITPSSIRGASGQPIRALALGEPVGSGVEKQKPDCSFLNGCETADELQEMQNATLSARAVLARHAEKCAGDE